MFKTKKAQFYIFTALVLIGYSMLLLQSFNVVPETSDTFRKAYGNFVFEADSAINNALFEGVDVKDEYDLFTEQFVSFALTKKLNIEVFSVLESGNGVYFINDMSDPVELLNLNMTLDPDESIYLLRSGLSDVSVKVNDDVFHENIYKFKISNKGTDLKTVLRLKKGARREIFVND